MSGDGGRRASEVEFAEASARLEAAYWRLLRFYPPGWRRERGAELVSVLMDVALAAGRSWPSRRDRLELAIFGGLARWESLFVGVPVRLRDRLADLSAVLLFGVTVTTVVFGEAAAWLAVDTRPHEWVGMGPSTAQVPLALLLAAFTCRVLAFRATAQVLYLATALLTPVTVVVGRLGQLDHPPATFMLVLAGASAFSAVSAPMHRTRERLAVGLAGALGAMAVLTLLHLSTAGMNLSQDIVSLSFYYFQSGSILITGLLWVTLPVFLVTLGVGCVRRDSRLALIVGAACLPWWAWGVAALIAQMNTHVYVDQNTALALAATVMAVTATGLLARVGVASGGTDQIRPLS